LNNIFVEVDPPTATNGSIFEENETNNKANKSFTVPSTHTFAGNLTGIIDLEKQSRNRSIYNWSTSNLSGSYLLVSDIEANINFFNLYAIGRNLSNQTTTGDFHSIDVRLGSTNFSDSINRTYTSNEQPIAKTNITLFGREILEVPLINSTQNITAFKTGILWDASDGGTRYDGTQDVVFLSNIEQQALGSRGTYDFEISIPALLRNYNAAGSVVAFYVELN
jgi:hypothetical protein